MKTGVLLATVSAVVAFAAPSSEASAPAPVVFAADRAPTHAGEIYRVDPNGHRIDLSNSRSEDTDPAVSPDGRHVAFISNRNGRHDVYEIGIRGRGLVDLGLARGPLAWQPNGNLLATGSYTGTSILKRGHKPILVRDEGFAVPQPWSPDGRVLLLENPSGLHGVSQSGRTLWTQPTEYGWSGWSATGLVAIPVGRTVTVYDEGGHVRLTFDVPTGGFGGMAWSPSGKRLAVIYDDALYNQKPKLRVITASGQVLLRRKRIPFDEFVWARESRIVWTGEGTCYCETVGINLRTGEVSPASSRWFDPLSADRKLAIVMPRDDPGFALGVAPPTSGAETKYRRVAGCYADGGWIPAVTPRPQFARGQSIVYGSGGYCDPPFSNLYSVAGTEIHRLTNVQAQETQPAVSPDGSQIAYVWARYTGASCKGCADGIRIASASGTPVRTLTNPDETNFNDCLYDDSPTWSPDGTTILYSESSCNFWGELFTIPAAGGTPHDLGVVGREPAWGPTRIAYVADGLWTADPDGGNPTLVSSHGGSPAWSVAGQLAYLDGKNVVIGSKVIQLPFTEVGADLHWTTDGTRLLITGTMANKSSGPGPFDLYSLKPDGTGLERLTKDYGVR